MTTSILRIGEDGLRRLRQFFALTAARRFADRLHDSDRMFLATRRM